MVKKIKLFQKTKERISAFLKRRPHRSFRRTRRRDYTRSLKLPGYFAFTKYVAKTVFAHWKTFLLLVLVSSVLTVTMVGIGSQDSLNTLTNTISTTSGDLFTSGWGKVGEASLLFLSAVTGGLSQELTELQQALTVVLVLFTWLTSVWLLRNMLAGHKVKLRDGLYSAGSPILATFIVAIVLLIQLLPFALALIGYSAAISTGLLTGGVEAMLFWIAAGLLTVLSLYWMTSTFFALVIITLPGMYPFRAIKIAGDLVIGRRLRILSRLLWMVIGILLTWVIILIPIIMLNSWVNGMWEAANWVPVVPVAVLILSTTTIIWASSYIYLLYRKVVADDAEPA